MLSLVLNIGTTSASCLWRPNSGTISTFGEIHSDCTEFLRKEELVSYLFPTSFEFSVISPVSLVHLVFCFVVLETWIETSVFA